MSTVSEAMSVRFPFAEPATTVADAAAVIQHYGWLPLPVVEDGGRLAGVVSEHDITRAVAERRDAQTTHVAEVALTELPAVAPDASLEDAAEAMRRAGAVLALVTDGEQLMGTFSVTDLVAQQLVGSVLGPAAADVVRDVSPDDIMYAGSWGAYAHAGVTAAQCVKDLLARHGRATPAHILDLPCGHGRELRYLKAMYPQARFTVCDIDAGGVEFCARVFDAAPVVSADDPARVNPGEGHDLAWCGSLFTHLAADRWQGFLELFARTLAPGGVLMFSVNGYLDDTTLQQLGLSSQRAKALAASFEREGFGYVDTEDGSWGLSMARPWWVKEQVAQSPLDLVAFERWAWKPPAPAQDVVVCCAPRQ